MPVGSFGAVALLQEAHITSDAEYNDGGPFFRRAGQLFRAYISQALPNPPSGAFVSFVEMFSRCVLQTWQRPTLPCLKTKYHRR